MMAPRIVSLASPNLGTACTIFPFHVGQTPKASKQNLQARSLVLIRTTCVVTPTPTAKNNSLAHTYGTNHTPQAVRLPHNRTRI